MMKSDVLNDDRISPVAAVQKRTPPGSTAVLRAMRSGDTNCEVLDGPYRIAPLEHADRDDVVVLTTQMTFGKPLIMNVFRSIVVEAIVAMALGDGWTWCGSDWAAYDFRGADGVRLEVKQSAARQSWASNRVTRIEFDIAARTGLYEGADWLPRPGRNADIYVFAYHPLTSDEADHRDPGQWQFYVVPAALLPKNKTIGLRAVERLAAAVSVKEVANAVGSCRELVRQTELEKPSEE